MEIKIGLPMQRYAKRERMLYVFGDVPYWFVGTKNLEPLMVRIEQGVDKDEFFSNVHPSVKSLVEDLIKKGIVLEEGKTGNEIARVTPNKRIWNVYDALEFELTLNCNLRCKHCAVNARKSLGNEISLKKIEETLDDLVDIHKTDMRGKRVVLTGGEPFIRKEINNIVDAIRERGLRTLINSNGLLINRKHIERLKGYDGLQVCISLDGLEKSHEYIRGSGTYKPTMEVIRVLCESGIKTSINMLCHKRNYKDLQGVVEATRGLELQGINPVPVALLGRADKLKIEPVPEKELYQEIFNLIKTEPRFLERFDRITIMNFMGALACNVQSHYCGTGARGTFFITHTGEVYPCPNMRYDIFKLGDIHKTPFRDIVKDSPVIVNLKRLNVDTMNSKCSKCDVRYFCGGFCRGETYAKTGDLKAPYIRCEEYKEGIIEAMWELSTNPEIYEAKAKEFLRSATS